MHIHVCVYKYTCIYIPMHIHTDKLSKQNMLDISKKQRSKPETGEGFQILPPAFDHETTIPGALPQGHMCQQTIISMRTCQTQKCKVSVTLHPSQPTDINKEIQIRVGHMATRP